MPQRPAVLVLHLLLFVLVLVGSGCGEGDEGRGDEGPAASGSAAAPEEGAEDGDAEPAGAGKQIGDDEVAMGQGAEDRAAKDRAGVDGGADTKLADGQGTGGTLARASGKPRVETVATGLDVPWEIAFLPDGRALVTERQGNVRLLTRRTLGRPILRVPVEAEGEGGLLGVAIDPDFERHPFVYLYRTGPAGNGVLRYRMLGRRLVDRTVLVDGMPQSGIHNGGRIHFGPDGRLYFSTGDASRRGISQDRSSLGGKFLRYRPDQFRGPGGRPEIVSIGHRNPQGFDWRPRDGALVAAEHGDIGNDEINIIRKGANYGWPRAEGRDHGRFAAPVNLYEDTIAPSGATFVSLPGSAWTGDFLVAALRGKQLRRLKITGNRVTLDQPLFAGRFGRLRTVVEGPDGALWVLTNNTDGRGSPGPSDDRLLRIVPPAS